MMRFKLKGIVFFVVLFTVLVFMVYLHSQLEEEKTLSVHHDVKPIVTNKISVSISNIALTSKHRNHERPCSLLKQPGQVTEKQKFEIVKGNNTYVFSAFYDDVSMVLRIISFHQKNRLGSFMCQMWYQEPHIDLVITPASIQNIPEDHGLKYSAVYLVCKLPDEGIPYAVSIVTKPCEDPLNQLKVIHSTEKKFKFTVCVTPFNFRYSRAYELVEWIEMNRQMGADHFVFYNHSTGVNVDSVLKLYEAKGLVSTVQWHLPMEVDHWPQTGMSEVHYFGQLGSLNDCLYRNLHRSEYIVYEDLDEILMPRVDRNWSSFLSPRIGNPSSSKTGAFVFKCSFFRKDWPLLSEDFKGKELAVKYRSIFLFTTLREKRIFPHNQRSKYIIVPEKVETVGIHNVWGMRFGNTIDKVDESHGLVHHYRNWEKPKEKLEKVTDMYMHTFKDDLLPRLENIWSQLKDVRLDIPLSEYPSPV